MEKYEVFEQCPHQRSEQAFDRYREKRMRVKAVVRKEKERGGG